MLPNNAKKAAIVGIRREHQKRIWERRVPLTPEAVYELIRKKGVEVHVEPSAKRVFKDKDYVHAGAKLVPNLSQADIVLGIKEPYPEDVLIGKPQTHFMFSHTIKGQEYNMPLLDRFVGRKHRSSKDRATLIDFELLTDEEGKRTVGFGWFAGVAGVLESLSAMAHVHLQRGVCSPFLYTPRPHTLPSLDKLRAALKEIGNQVVAEGMPWVSGPLIIGLTGNGQVAQGCLSMLSELPIAPIKVNELEHLATNPGANRHKVYLLHVQPSDYLVRTDGGAYSREHYHSHPSAYISTFSTTIAPYLSLLLNGAGWSPVYPRLMSNEQLLATLTKAKTATPEKQVWTKGVVYGDISCDVEGGLEFTKEATTLSSPTFDFLPEWGGVDVSTSTGEGNTNPKGQAGPDALSPVTVMSVDILPASIPLDASIHFSEKFVPYLEAYLDKWEVRSRYEDTKMKVGELLATGGISGFASPSSITPTTPMPKSGLADIPNSAPVNTYLPSSLLQDLTNRIKVEHRERLSEARSELQEAKRNIETLKEREGKEGELHRSLEKGVIASEGRLVGKHQWLGVGLDRWRNAEPGQDGDLGKSVVETSSVLQSAPTEQLPEPDDHQEILKQLETELARPVWYEDSMKDKRKTGGGKLNILVLGSGMVAKPLVDYLAQRSATEVNLVVASNSLHELQELVGPHLAVKYRVIDASREETYEYLVKDADVVVSLLPAPMHPSVASLCITHSSNLLTASYTSPSMLSLSSAASAKGIQIINELGLDPGLDHCAAMAMVDNIKERKGLVTGFTSFCGGLPRWEDAAGVPLRYKFSWSPMGVLRATKNDAKFLLGKKTYEIEGKNLLRAVWPDVPISDEMPFEGLPNRDSFDYMELYGLKHCQTFLRGTLRYPGFSSLMQSFRTLGLLQDKHRIRVKDWSSFVTQCMQMALPSSRNGVLPPLASLVSEQELGPLAEALDQLGLVNTRSNNLISGSRSMPPLPQDSMTPMEVFSYLLAHKLKYEQHERDMVVLSHQMAVSFPPSASSRSPSREIHTSTLITYGTQGLADFKPSFPGERPASAMARTVGLPLAIGALLVGKGHLAGLGPGIFRPTHKAVYEPVLAEMQRLGLGMEESVVQVPRGAPQVPAMVESEDGVIVRVVEDALEQSWSLAARGLGGKRTEEEGLAMREFRDLDLDQGWKEEEVVEWRSP